MLLPSHLDVTDVEGLMRMCKENVLFLHNMIGRESDDLRVVTWQQDDLKKVAIVGTQRGGPVHPFTRFFTYASASSSESEFMAIKQMLHTLQARVAAFMPSIAMHERVAVLNDGLHLIQTVESCNENLDFPILDNMAVERSGRLITATIEMPRKDLTGLYTTLPLCSDGLQCSRVSTKNAHLLSRSKLALMVEARLQAKIRFVSLRTETCVSRTPEVSGKIPQTSTTTQ